jgi:hypothetical protein
MLAFDGLILDLLGSIGAFFHRSLFYQNSRFATPCFSENGFADGGFVLSLMDEKGFEQKRYRLHRR